MNSKTLSNQTPDGGKKWFSKAWLIEQKSLIALLF